MQCWRAIFRAEKQSALKSLGLKYMMIENIEEYMKKNELYMEIDINIWSVQGEEKNRINPM